MYEHDKGDYNNFYNTPYNSYVDVIFNDAPSTIKSFKTLNYEGSQAKVVEEKSINFITGLPNTGYYNLNQKQGWHVTKIDTDQDEGLIGEFIEKEGKWFNYIRGKNNII